MASDSIMQPTCEQEINSFQNSGITGLVRLKQILPSVFRFYGVNTSEAMHDILRRCNLVPVVEDHYVTFYLDVSPENPYPTTRLMSKRAARLEQLASQESITRESDQPAQTQPPTDETLPSPRPPPVLASPQAAGM